MAVVDGASERSRAIDAFVERLTRVRDEGGRPSFREMAKRSGAISHATLHDALQGARLPSWETTVEFATACGTDPQELRGDWEQAAAIVRATTEGCAEDPDTLADAAPEPVEPSAEPEPAAGTPPSPDPPRRGGPLLGIGVGVAAIAVIAALATLLLTREEPSDAATSTRESGEAAVAYTSFPDAPSTTTGAKGCPGNAAVPADAAPRNEGDESEFVSDVTVPDCSVQGRGESVVKTWKLKNSGTVDWEGRSLHRVNAHEGSSGCRAPERVAIPDTEPGETVEVSVTIATPDRAATCFGRWMQTDEDGNFTFPGQRPYYYTFLVK